MTRVKLADNVVFRSFGSETVLLNLTSGQYHGVKGSGGRMLELLTETGDVDLAAQQVADEFGHPVAEVRRDMDELCQALAQRNLLQVDDETTTSPSA